MAHDLNLGDIFFLRTDDIAENVQNAHGLVCQHRAVAVEEGLIFKDHKGITFSSGHRHSIYAAFIQLFHQSHPQFLRCGFWYLLIGL